MRRCLIDWVPGRCTDSRGAQGLVDLQLAGSDAPAGSPQEVLHLLLCVDLSRCSEDFGLSPDPFPQRYV